MSRPKKYTAKTLDRAVENYFASISRRVKVTEKVDSGERDGNGHVIWREKEIISQLGEPVVVTEYLVPPGVGGLCDFLDIHRSTWADYCDREQHPEFSDTTTRARERMRAWREEQLLTRKDVKGVIFDLQNNYGYSEKHEMELGDRAGKAVSAAGMTMEEKLALLREAAQTLQIPEDGETGGGADA